MSLVVCSHGNSHIFDGKRMQKEPSDRSALGLVLLLYMNNQRSVQLHVLGSSPAEGASYDRFLVAAAEV